EREHMDTLIGRYHVDLTPVFDAHAIEHAVVFAGVDQRIGDAEDLFRVAIDMEESAARFFEATAGSSTTGTPAQRLYRELAAEEREHAALLRTEQARWQERKSGLVGATREELPPIADRKSTRLNSSHDQISYA